MCSLPWLTQRVAGRARIRTSVRLLPVLVFITTALCYVSASILSHSIQWGIDMVSLEGMIAIFYRLSLRFSTESSVWHP